LGLIDRRTQMFMDLTRDYPQLKMMDIERMAW